jgi:hypothetical protein
VHDNVSPRHGLTLFTTYKVGFYILQVVLINILRHIYVAQEVEDPFGYKRWWGSQDIYAERMEVKSSDGDTTLPSAADGLL